MINDSDILKNYKSKVNYLKNNSKNLKINSVLVKIHKILIYMNRFRNTDLKVYFDEDINRIIESITLKKKIIS